MFGFDTKYNNDHDKKNFNGTIKKLIICVLRKIFAITEFNYCRTISR